MPRPDPDQAYRSRRPHRQLQLGSLDQQTKVLTKAELPLAGRKNQTTLTQLDYCTPNGSFTSIKSGDSSEHDDEDSEGPRRKKQRKGNVSRLAQTTLTQLPWSSAPPIPDEVSVTDLETIQETQWQARSQASIVADTEDDPDSTVNVFSHGQTAQESSAGDRSPKDHEAICESPVTPRARATRARDAYASNQANGRHDREVPETPRTGSSSIAILASPRSIAESPLKTRVEAQSPEFVALTPHGPERIDGTAAGSMRHFRSVSPRVSPIPFRKPLLPVRHTQVMPNLIPASGKGVRTLTVEDSQVEDFGEVLEDEELVESTYVPNSGLKTTPTSDARVTHGHGSMTQFSIPASVYDPVMSALNRDESRFGETQRLDRQDVRHTSTPKVCEPTTQVHDFGLSIGLDGVIDDSTPKNIRGSLEARVQANRTIDLTSEPPASQPGTPTSAAGSPDRRLPRPNTHTRLPDSSPPRPSQATTVDDCLSVPPSPSRIPQTYLPKFSPPVERFSPPPPGIPSSSQDVISFNRRRPLDRTDDELEADLEERPTRRDRETDHYPNDDGPDSLLDFTIPPAPPWTSSALAEWHDPAAKMTNEGYVEDVDGDDDEEEDEDEASSTTAGGRSGLVDELGVDLRSSPPLVVGQKDYSLDPPSSDWRSNSSGGVRRR